MKHIRIVNRFSILVCVPLPRYPFMYMEEYGKVSTSCRLKSKTLLVRSVVDQRDSTHTILFFFFFSCDKSPLPALDTNMAKCFPSYTGSLELLLLVLPFDYFPSLNLETSLFLVEAQRKIYCSVPP